MQDPGSVHDGISISSRPKECSYHFEGVGANYINFYMSWFDVKSNDDFSDGIRAGYVCDRDVCVSQFNADLIETTRNYDGHALVSIIGDFPLGLKAQIADTMRSIQERWAVLNNS